MPPTCGFGFCQEDERVDAAVLAPAPGRRLLVVASGGEPALGLVARGASVHAVDVAPAQLHLTALKLAAALALPAAEAAAFLGYAEASPAARRGAWDRVRPHLPDGPRAFWDANPEAVAGGALWSGRFERFVRPVLGGLRRVWGRRHVDALCRAASRDEREAVFDRHVGRPWVRAVFRAVFHPRVYRRRGIDDRALAQRADPTPLGEQYWSWFRAFCTATPGPDNWFLQVLLRGALLDPERGPDFLRPDGVTALRGRADGLALAAGDLREVVAAGGAWDGASVSNLGDWLDGDAFAGLLAALARALPPGAPVLWRELQVVREPPPGLVADRAAGEALRAGDRFPFYRVVPARVDHAHAAPSPTRNGHAPSTSS